MTLALPSLGDIMEKCSLGPILGPVKTNEASFWIQSASWDQFEVVCWRGSGQTPLETRRGVGRIDHERRHTGVARVADLQPGVVYRYSLREPPQSIQPQAFAPASADTYPSFRTFPASSNKYDFAFGSCYKPLEHPGNQTFQALLKEVLRRRGTDQEIWFLVMLGDNIYADETRLRHGKATTVEQYYEAYEETWKQIEFRRALAHLPVFMIFDDHEVQNDWNKDPRFPVPSKQLGAALHAYEIFQDSHNPRPSAFRGPDERRYGYSYDFRFSNDLFLVLDCRSLRELERPAPRTWETALGRLGVVRRFRERSMLGREQKGAFLHWLQTHPKELKFIVSSVPFIHVGPGRLSYALIDQWPGSETERKEILDRVVAGNVENLHILSGDVHFASSVELRPRNGTGKPVVHQYVSSPLANARRFWHRIGAWINARIGVFLDKVEGFELVKERTFTGYNYGLVSVDHVARSVDFRIVGSNAAKHPPHTAEIS